MAKIILPGRGVARYTVIEELSRGTVAIAYKARDEAGKLVFLKQYNAPTKANPWFDAYVKYEWEKKRRIDHSDAREYCLTPIDIFVEVYGAPTLFQVFEFVENGEDLRASLRRLGTSSTPATWERRLVYSKVFLAALHEVSKIGLVHGDLKPENIHLIENKSIKAGYRPRLIDMDRSLLTDKKAPWEGLDGHAGHMGTPNYFSPEHGSVPSPASDVFTASLILHELLCKVRPYPEYGGASEVINLIKAAPAPTPILRGSLGNPEKDGHLKRVLQECLSLDYAKRPSIAKLREAVLGRGAVVEPPPPRVTLQPPRRALRVACGGGKPLEFNISTGFDHMLARGLDPATPRPSGTYFNFLCQAGEWYTEVGSTATKCALLRNGAALKGKSKISNGDVIRVEWASGAIPPLELKVELV